MEALNKKERNAAILRFALWFALCILVICVPIILTTYVPEAKCREINKGNDSILMQIEFERGYFAVKIKDILFLMKENQEGKIIAEEFNAKLMNIIEEIKVRTQNQNDWRGNMYRDVIFIANYLIEANNKLISADKILEEAKKNMEEADKKVAEAEKKVTDMEKKIAESKEKLADFKERTKKDLNKINTEFENFGKEINDLGHSGLAGNNKSDVRKTRQKFDQILAKLKETVDDL